jgi:hypothetical protein
MPTSILMKGIDLFHNFMFPLEVKKLQIRAFDWMFSYDLILYRQFHLNNIYKFSSYLT